MPVKPPSPAPASSSPESPKVQLVTIDEGHADQRIDNFLITRLKGVPKSHIYRILRGGEVRVNKGRIDQTYRLQSGDVVRIPPVRMEHRNPSKEAGFQPKMPESACPDWTILFEDDALLALNKPAGWAVHGGSGIAQGVIEALRQSRPDARFLELVHRLDRETSGVLLIAKKRSALVAMHAMLRGETTGGRMAKHYDALVEGEWPHERKSVRIKLAKYVTREGERRVAVDEEDGQESHTIFVRRETTGGATLMDCDIRTGRTHQIRVHLASLGFPIIGDDKYGDFALNKRVASKANGGLKRMFLHAREVKFKHPLTGVELSIIAPLAPELVRYLDFRRRLGDAKKEGA